MRRFGLTRTFALVSLLAMVALGAALVFASSTLLRQQAMAAGSQNAETYVRLALDGDRQLKDAVRGSGSVITDSAARRRPAQQARPASASDTSGTASTTSLIEVRVWTRNEGIVFDTDPLPPSGADALSGLSGLTDQARFDQARGRLQRPRRTGLRHLGRPVAALGGPTGHQRLRAALLRRGPGSRASPR